MKEKLSAGDIIDRLAKRSGITKKLAAEVIRAIPEVIEEGLLSDGEAKVRGLGTFRLKTVAAKKGRNPLTGEEVLIPPHDKLTFLPEESFREELNEEYKFLGIKVLESVGGQRSAVSGPEPGTIGTSGTFGTPVAETEVVSRQSSVVSTDPVVSHQSSVVSPEPGTIGTSGTFGTVYKKRNYWLIPTAIGIVILLSVVFYWRNFYPGQRSAVGGRQSSVVSNEPVATTQEEATALNDTVVSRQSSVVSPDSGTPGTSGTPVTPGTSGTPVTQDSTLNTKHSTLNTSPPTTQAGTHLFQMAREAYGSPFLWVLIYRANLDKISNPDQVVMGKDLVIPALEGTPKKLTHNDSLAVSDGYRLVYEYYLDNGDPRAEEFQLVMVKYKPR